MARYIDVEKLIDFKFAYITNERYRDGKLRSEKEIYSYKVGYNEAIDNIIQFATTADVVEVIRCKECSYHELDGNGDDWCVWSGNNIKLTDFCSIGERKEDVQIH